jgi:membrane-bound inhibitor of C-type lysozyme
MRALYTVDPNGLWHAAGKTTFWNKGRSALIKVNDKIVVQDCVLEGEP